MGQRVLVVEDHVESGAGLVELLGLWGHEARLATDGPAALALADDFQPTVALVDLGLPGGLDGHALAGRLRARPDAGDLILVALTGQTGDEARRRARAAGFDHHLAKPLDLGALERILGT